MLQLVPALILLILHAPVGDRQIAHDASRVLMEVLEQRAQMKEGFSPLAALLAERSSQPNGGTVWPLWLDSNQSQAYEGESLPLSCGFSAVGSAYGPPTDQGCLASSLRPRDGPVRG